MLDQLEERRLGPVDVLEQHDERAGRARVPRAACERPRRAPRPGTRSATARSRTRHALRPRRPPTARRASVAPTSVESRSRIPAAWRTASASGQNVMPSPYGRQRPRRNDTPSSVCEPMNSSMSRDLPDAGLADHRDEPTAPAPRPPRRARLRKPVELALTTDHRRIEAPRALGVLAHADEAVGGHGLGLALELERLDLLDVDVVANEPVREVAEQDLLGTGSLLEAGGDVDGVARHEPLARRSGRRRRPRPCSRPCGPSGARPRLALELVVQRPLAPAACRRQREQLGARRPRAASATRTRP